MSKKVPLVFIEHIMENINDIEKFSRNLEKDDIEKNRLRNKAIIRSIEVIGEAVKNIPSSIKSKYPEVAWKDISGTRDTLIHHYFGIDFDILWNIIKKDIPVLKKQIQKIKEDLKND